jgi:hypothetical protein
MGPLQVLVTAPLSLPFLALFGRRGWGDCNIYLAKKKAPFRLEPASTQR